VTIDELRLLIFDRILKSRSVTSKIQNQQSPVVNQLPLLHLHQHPMAASRAIARFTSTKVSSWSAGVSFRKASMAQAAGGSLATLRIGNPGGSTGGISGKSRAVGRR
jgi:hypothetical protein